MQNSSFSQPEIVEIAGFKLTKYGSLKRKEEKWFAARDKVAMTGMVDILKISQEIAATNEIDPMMAYQIVSAYGSEVGSELLVPYASRLEPLVDLLDYQESTPAEAVTMILQSRLNSAWLIENRPHLDVAFGIKIAEGITHWQSEYTEELPRAIRDELFDFINGERSQWKEIKPEPDPTVGEDLASIKTGSASTTTIDGEPTTGLSNAVA
jgi:hypothetical protein